MPRRSEGPHPKPGSLIWSTGTGKKSLHKELLQYLVVNFSRHFGDPAFPREKGDDSLKEPVHRISVAALILDSSREMEAQGGLES